MGEVADITPTHEPISLAREMVERAPGCAAGVCVLVRPDGSLWYDMAGVRHGGASPRRRVFGRCNG
jgi:hypothetical protein